jgi:hypothetical protein
MMELTELQTLDNDFVLILTALVRLVIFAMILERGLYFVFDWSLWRDWLPGKKVKAPIALAVAWILSYWHDFDLISIILNAPDGSSDLGIFVTACIVAGGSQSAMILFQDVLGFTREARAALRARRAAEAEGGQAGNQAES